MDPSRPTQCLTKWGLTRWRSPMFATALLFAAMSLVPVHASDWAVWSKPRVLNNGDKTCNAISATTSPRMDFMQIRQPDGGNHYILVVRSDAIPASLTTGQVRLVFPDGHQDSLPFRRSASRGSPILMQVSASRFTDLLGRFAVSGNIQVSASSSKVPGGSNTAPAFNQSFSGYGTGPVTERFEKCREQF